MQKVILSIVLSILIKAGFAQSIPTDSLYLGQTLPGSVPEVFKLSVSP
jgi:hypothetical protein